MPPAAPVMTNCLPSKPSNPPLQRIRMSRPKGARQSVVSPVTASTAASIASLAWRRKSPLFYLLILSIIQIMDALPGSVVEFRARSAAACCPAANSRDARVGHVVESSAKAERERCGGRAAAITRVQPSAQAQPDGETRKPAQRIAPPASEISGELEADDAPRERGK